VNVKAMIVHMKAKILQIKAKILHIKAKIPNPNPITGITLKLQSMGCGSHLRWRSWYAVMGHLIQEMMGRTIKFHGWMYISLPFLVTKFSDYIKVFLARYVHRAAHVP
jgi:hypothetical protein